MEECIQVKIELGHKAILRAKPTPDGFTHDWTLYVRGSEGSSIQHFVERVVFHLHESFPKPKRVVKEPPYQISESGYAGFMMKIEVNFKNKEEPKRVFFDYDLYLQLDGPPLSKFRAEKLTFKNPTEDFKRKVFLSGGVVGILGSEGGLNPLQKPSPSSNSHCSSQSKSTKHFSEAIKAPKSSTVSVPSANTTPSNTKEIKSTPALQPPQTFVDVFGQPYKASKASPDSQKVKDLHSKHSKSKPSTTSSFPNEQSSSNSNITKDPKSSLSKETKDQKDYKKEKAIIKRSQSPVLPAIESLQVKKKKHVSSSNSSSKSKDDKKRSEKRSSSKSKDKKDKREKHRHSSDGGATKFTPAECKNSETKSIKEIEDNVQTPKKSKHPPSTSPSLSNSSTGSENTKSSRSLKASTPSPQRVDESFEPGYQSPSSSISLSPVHNNRGHGPLGALMAAYQEGDILSPMSSDSADSPPPPLQEEEQDVPDTHMQQPICMPQSPPSSPNPPSPVVLEKSEKPKGKEVNLASRKKKTSLSKVKTKKNKKKRAKLPPDVPTKKSWDMQNNEHVSCATAPETLTKEYANELQELQIKLMTLRERRHLDRIVDIIEETGLFKISSTTFDFDLCKLDRGTVIRLQKYFASGPHL